MKFILALLSLLISSVMYAKSTNQADQKHATEVYIISSLHKNHQGNSYYTYDTLYAKVAAIQPEVLGVEIRAIDISKYPYYLDKYYPLEMTTLWKNYKENIAVYGFDWMGELTAQDSLSETFFDNLEARKLQMQLQNDTLFNKQLLPLNPLKNAKMEIISKCNFQQMHNGVYDSLNTAYYKIMDSIMWNTPYQVLAKFYTQRDSAIAQNIIQIIQQHKGKRIVCVLGGDHRAYTSGCEKSHFQYLNCL
jgi:hypothetical protein